jgi:hypothetical protein
MKKITITQPETPDGKPTCSADINDNCVFLLTRSFGQRFVCSWCPESVLLRDGENGLGYLQPSEGCIFNDAEEL